MPKEKVATEEINREIFIQILKIKKSSIRKLDKEDSIHCSDKTLRRSLSKGGMRMRYIEEIAQYLDVSTDLLTGKLVQRIYPTGELSRNQLERLVAREPFFRSTQEKMMKEDMKETLERILSLFEISYEQFWNKDYDERYLFQHDLLEAILPVIYKHFDRDGYGDTDMMSCQRIIADLESAYDDYYISMEERNENQGSYDPKNPVRSELHR